MTREEIKVIFDEHLSSLDCLNNDTEMAMYLRLLDAAERIVKNCNIHNVVVSEAELCDNPNCEDGIVDYDYYKHPICCQVCDKHN